MARVQPEHVSEVEAVTPRGDETHRVTLFDGLCIAERIDAKGERVVAYFDACDGEVVDFLFGWGAYRKGEVN